MFLYTASEFSLSICIKGQQRGRCINNLLNFLFHAKLSFYAYKYRRFEFKIHRQNCETDFSYLLKSWWHWS